MTEGNTWVPGGGQDNKQPLVFWSHPADLCLHPCDALLGLEQWTPDGQGDLRPPEGAGQ